MTKVSQLEQKIYFPNNSKSNCCYLTDSELSLPALRRPTGHFLKSKEILLFFLGHVQNWPVCKSPHLSPVTKKAGLSTIHN